MDTPKKSLIAKGENNLVFTLNPETREIVDVSENVRDILGHEPTDLNNLNPFSDDKGLNLISSETAYPWQKDSPTVRKKYENDFSLLTEEGLDGYQEKYKEFEIKKPFAIDLISKLNEEVRMQIVDIISLEESGNVQVVLSLDEEYDRLKKEHKNLFEGHNPIFEVIKEEDGWIYSDVNQRVTNDIQKGKDEIVGKTLYEVLRKEDADKLQKKLNEAIELGEKTTFSDSFILNGKNYEFKMIVYPSKKGASDRALVVIDDHTKQIEANYDLQEIMKEANCLLEISFLQGFAEKLEDVYNYIPNVVKKAWQFPDATEVKLSIDGMEYMTDQFSKEDVAERNILSQDIVLQGKSIGVLEIMYTKQFPDSTKESLSQEPQGPFMGSEIGILNAVAEILGRTKQLAVVNEIVDETPDTCAFLWDAKEWGVEYVSGGLEKITGYTKEDFDTHRIRYEDIVHKNDLEGVLNALNKYSQDKGKESFTDNPYRIVTKNGEIKWVAGNTKILRNADREAVYYQGIVRDITKQIELIEKSNQARSMQTIGTLVGGISHNFNNLSYVVSGYTDLALGDEVNDRVKECLEETQKANTRMAVLIEQLLTISKRSNIEKSTIKVQEVITESLKSLPESMFEVELDISENVYAIEANADEIRKVIRELCLNAQNAMKDDSEGSIKIAVNNVTIPYVEDSSPFGDYVKISVSDTGKGIKKKDIDKVFDPFFTTSECNLVGEETGMGLASARGIIANHDGDIKAFNNEDVGATFEILLPASQKKVSADKIKERGELPKGNESAEVLKGKGSILVVDDDESVGTMLAEQLKRLGYTVTYISNPQEVSNQDLGSFDLVFTDRKMPEMTGEELAEMVHEKNPDVPIIMLTGFSGDLDDVKGIKKVLAKPATREELLETTRSLIDEAKKED